MIEKAKQFHRGCWLGCWLIVIAQLAVLFFQWSSLPDQIPGHYNGTGQIDRWGSKLELLLLPCISIGLILGLEWVSRHPEWWNIPAEVTENNREALQAVTLRILSLMQLLVILELALLEFFSMTSRPLPVVLTIGFVLIILALMIAAILWILRTADQYR